MKRLALFIMLACLSAFGQGGIHQNVALNNTGNIGSPYASVRVCSITSTGIPCTPTVTIWSDQGETQPLGNPFSADAYGNYSFWAVPGFYVVQVTALNQPTPYYVYIAEINSDPNNPIFQTVTLQQPITQANQAATKAYVDNAIGNIPSPFYQTIQVNGAGGPQRAALNFTGPFFSLSDNPVLNRTGISLNTAGTNGQLLATFAGNPGTNFNCVQMDGAGGLQPTGQPCQVSGLISWNGRTTPAATPQANDYSFSLIAGSLGLGQVLPITNTYTMSVTNSNHATTTSQWDHTPGACTAGNPITSVSSDTAGNLSCSRAGANPTFETVSFGGCTTPVGTGQSCDNTQSWGTPFVDNNYQVVCMANAPFTSGSTSQPNAVQFMGLVSQTASQIVVRTASQGSGQAASVNSITCIAIHF